MNSTITSVRNMTLMALFAALLAVSGAFSIQFGPAPITLQTMVVMLAGSVLGAQRGFISMLVFIALVAVGAPVLSGGKGGLVALFGPTGGYILSWPFAAWLIGFLVEKWGKKDGVKAWHLVAAHIIGGIALVHLFGFPWLVLSFHLPLNMDTFMKAFLIFMPGDFLKAFAAAPVALALYRAMPSLKPKADEKQAA
jgi:biotin transport system substrate-specific component